MIFKLSSLHKFFFTYICPRFYGSPPAAPSETTSNVTQNNIPAELMPYMMDVLNKGQGLTSQTYKPFSTNAQDYVAGFSPLQQQAQKGAANLKMPGQFGQASQLARAAGAGSMMAGQNYANQATDPNAVGAYMNPYLQQSLAPQLQLLNQQFGIQGAQQQGAATQAGAFGGSREALSNAMVGQGQSLAQQQMIGQGYNQAFQQAQNAQQFGAGLELQGYGQGIQAAGQLGGLGTAQLAAQTGILDTQGKYGAQQQAQQQQAIDQAIQNYQNAQNYPYMQLGFMSNLIRGTPTGNTTETRYQAQPSWLQQVGGALGTAGSLYGAATAKKAEGGSIKDNSYAEGGIVGYFGGGSVEGSMRSKLEDMTPQQLQNVISSSSSNEVRSMAKEILAQESFARGGIVAFADQGYVEDPNNPKLGDILEDAKQRKLVETYRTHGWTDEDIADYKSSGRVPLDPQKQLALRAPEAEIPLPNEGESGAYNRYEEIQRNARRVPESEVINLGDDNARKPRAKTEAPFESVKKGREVGGVQAERGAYEDIASGPQKGIPRGPIEGEYVPASKATAGGSLGAPEQEPIDSRTMYSDETKKYKDAMERRRADMAAGKKQPMNAGMAQEEKVKQFKANQKMGAEATVDRPTGTGPDVKKYTEGEAPTGELGKNIKQGIKGAGEKIKGAGKTIGKALMSPELLVPAAQEYRAEQFKTGEGDALTKGLQGVQAGPALALEALQRAVLGGSTADEFRKASPKLAAFIDETGKTVEDRFNAVKDYFTGEPSAEDRAQPSRAEAQQVATEMGAPAQAIPFVSEGLNAPNVAPSFAAPQPQQPPMGLGSSAPAGVVPPAQQPSFGGTADGSEILRANLASEPQAIEQVANTAAEVVAAKTEQDMPFYMKQVQEMYKQQGLGNNEGANAMREEIMGELANKDAEEKRQTYLRMAEFFSHWGSTPGAPLAAGMKSLIATMPGYLEDKKDQAKLQRGLQDSLYKLNQADRLEKFGMIKEAAALKHEASQFDQGMIKLQHEAVQNRLRDESQERIARLGIQGRERIAMLYGDDSEGRYANQTTRGERNTNMQLNAKKVQLKSLDSKIDNATTMAPKSVPALEIERNNLIKEMNDLVKNSVGASESTGETDAQRRARIASHMTKEQSIGN